MPRRRLRSFLVVGAGAAGLMAVRELARGGRSVTILEARDRCGGRIYPLPVDEFGYAAEGGAEFVHGTADVTCGLLAEAGLALLPRGGSRWSTRTGRLAPDRTTLRDADRFVDALRAVEADLPIAEFLDRHFGAPQYSELRRSITRTVEGYDAADPNRFSTIALREEWLGREEGRNGRIERGYGALVDYLGADSRRHGAAIHFGAAVAAIEERPAGVAAICRDGTVFEADAAILAMPLPILAEFGLPSAARQRIVAGADIGFGNVVKLLLRFTRRWWADCRGGALADLSFLVSDAPVPTWWTQFPEEYPLLTGWYAGPKADRVSALGEDGLVDMGLASLAEILAVPLDRLKAGLVASRAINWGNDPFARGAYSYATPGTRSAQIALKQSTGPVFFCGEALYAGPDIGTVEAALADGRDRARMILEST